MKHLENLRLHDHVNMCLGCTGISNGDIPVLTW